MFGIGETELVIIVVFAFLLFGPDKLPGMGRTLGRVLRQFREASDGFTEVVQTNIMDPASEELEKSPKQRKREEAANRSVDGAESESAEAEEQAPKRETFAERKARLAAERAAAEAAEASQETESPNEAQEGDAADVAQGAEQEGAGESAPASAADLYAMTSRKSSRSRSSEANTGEEDGSAEA